MAINYSVVGMKNPSDPDSSVKFYAKAQASGVPLPSSDAG